MQTKYINVHNKLLDLAAAGKLQEVKAYITTPQANVIDITDYDAANCLAISQGHLETALHLLNESIQLLPSNKIEQGAKEKKEFMLLYAAHLGQLHITKHLVHLLPTFPKIDTQIWDRLFKSDNYHVISYLCTNGWCNISQFSPTVQQNFTQYKLIEDKFLPSANPLVHQISLTHLDEIKNFHLLKVKTTTTFTISSSRVEVSSVQVELSLNTSHSAHLNIDINHLIDKYSKSYNKPTSTWLALIEANQVNTSIEKS